MQAQMISEIWGELKRYINSIDRLEAAESMITIMIEHDFDLEELRKELGHDPDLKRALTAYLDQDHDEAEDVEEEEELDYDDENWDN